MKRKKSDKADLEKKRVLFFQLGMAISLSLVLLALEWSCTEKNDYTFIGSDKYLFEEEMTEITYMEENDPPVPRPTDVYEIEIVDDDEVIEDVIDIDAETTIDELFNYVFTDQDDEDTEVLPFFLVEEKPGFNNGGVEKFRSYVGENIKYTSAAVGLGLFGKVFVQFTVNEKGRVTDAKILRGIDPLLDNEVLRVVESSPLWTPGKQRGKAVRVTFTMPVNFELQ